MENMVVVQNVNKSFKNNTVLKDINLSLEKGKIHGLIGRNGSGKTVLIKVICGFIHPDSGYVLVDNKQVGKDVDFPQNIGAIIEAPGFLPYRSGYKNLEYLASLRNKIGKKEICDTMRLVGLNPDDKKRVGKYSLGMKQRLGLAQAIMENPSLLILDEPMNGLDKEGVADMRNLLLKFKEDGKTVLLVSHSSEDIDVLCDTVHIMEKGVLSNEQRQC